MPAQYCPDQDSITVSQDTMIDEQSSASGHDYASDRSAIGAGGSYSVWGGGIRLLFRHLVVPPNANVIIVSNEV